MRQANNLKRQPMKLGMDKEVVNFPLVQIKPYNNNPRKNDKSITLLKKAIKEFGFLVPITIDKDGVIVTGHSRYTAARALGLKEIPCIVLDLTEKELKEYRLADNATADHTSFDQKGLSAILNDSVYGDFSDYFKKGVIQQGDGVIEQGFNNAPNKVTLSGDIEHNEEDFEEEDDEQTVICPHCLHEFESEV